MTINTCTEGRLMHRPTPPPWADLAPLTAFDGLVFAPHDLTPRPISPVATVEDVKHPDAVADLITAAPTYALL